MLVILALEYRIFCSDFIDFIYLERKTILNYFLFFLNLLITVCHATSIASAYFLTRVRGGRVFIALCALFGLYFIDNTIVSMTEMLPSFAAVYDSLFLASPIFKAAIHICLVFCYMFITKQILREKVGPLEYALLFIHAMALFGSSLIPGAAASSWAFYAPTQLFNMGLAIYGLIRINAYPKDYLRKFYRLYKKLAVFSIIMNLMILLEDTYVIFYVDDYSTATLDIFNRNLSENIMVIGYASVLLRYTRLVLKNRDISVFGPVFIPPGNVISSTDAFCNIHSLTDREKDVFLELLEGYSISEISEKLYISTGTVKTHIHNLYRKTNVSRKSELLRMYAEFEHGIQTPSVNSR